LFNRFAYYIAWYMPKLDVLFLQIVAMSSAVTLLQMGMQDNTARGSNNGVICNNTQDERISTLMPSEIEDGIKTAEESANRGPGRCHAARNTIRRGLHR
jgi:hypothetical protein